MSSKATPPRSQAGPQKGAAPRRAPEDLAELVSCLSNQEKAEITFELVCFAARAAKEGDYAALSEFLAELEDMAEVYADPRRRREMQREVAEAAQPQRAGEGHPPVSARPRG